MVSVVGGVERYACKLVVSLAASRAFRCATSGSHAFEPFRNRYCRLNSLRIHVSVNLLLRDSALVKCLGRGGHGSSAAAGQRQAYEGVSTSAVLDDVNSHSWTALGRLQPVNSRKRIFCNRSLNMKSIVAVGFDMDYTLAQYKPDTFETLAYNGTIKKLVYDLGYPEEVSGFSFAS